MGSVIAATTATGAISWREQFTPFGERLIDEKNTDAPSFTSHIFDDATGLTYMQARYYDPVIGRFLSTDPVGYQDQFNLYAYVANDPVNATDPTGQSAVTKFIKQTIKHRGNVIEAAVDIGDTAVTVFAPGSTGLERLVAAAELVLPVSPGDIKDAKRGIEAAGKALGGRRRLEYAGSESGNW